MRESLLQRLDLAAEAGQAHGYLVQLLAQRLEALELRAYEARVRAEGAGELLLRPSPLVLELARDALDQRALELAHALVKLAFRLRPLPGQHQQADADESEPQGDA